MKPKKHKMVVDAVGYRPQGWIKFQCENCPASVIIERPVWYKIMVEGDKRFVTVLGKWSVCRGTR